MRDFRDAKFMAHALRDALKAKAIETTHAETPLRSVHWLQILAGSAGHSFATLA